MLAHAVIISCNETCKTNLEENKKKENPFDNASEPVCVSKQEPALAGAGPGRYSAVRGGKEIYYDSQK